MSYTPFGEYVRILRIKNHQVMGDLAKVLNTSTPYLSAVENGKKNVPSDWIHKIIDYYQLTPAEQNELLESVEESKVQYKINTASAGVSKRKAALQFARSFDEMSDETAQKILELLNNGEDNK